MTNEPVKCFECGSDMITQTDRNTDEDTVYLTITCMDCGHEWVDVYEYTRSFDPNGDILKEIKK